MKIASSFGYMTHNGTDGTNMKRSTVTYVKKYAEAFKFILRNRPWKVKVKVVCLFGYMTIVTTCTWPFPEKGERDPNGLKESKRNGSAE